MEKLDKHYSRHKIDFSNGTFSAHCSLLPKIVCLFDKFDVYTILNVLIHAKYKHNHSENEFWVPLTVCVPYIVF